MNEVTVVIKKPNESARQMKIGDDLKSWQSFVGGNIEVIRVIISGERNTSLICNEVKVDEDGNPLEHGFSHPVFGKIYGNLFIIKQDKEGNPIDLNESDLKNAIEYLNKFSI